MASDQASGSDDTPSDYIVHPLVQRQLGFYSVLLPLDYDVPKHKEKSYPLCLNIHGAMGDEFIYEKVIDRHLKRDGVIYLTPRAPYAAFNALRKGKTGYTVMPNFPKIWGLMGSEGFPNTDVENLDIRKLYVDFIADCVADAKSRYRITEGRFVIFGFSQGASFAFMFAIAYPLLVRAFFAGGSFYGEDSDKQEAAKVFKENQVYPFITHCRDDGPEDAIEFHRILEKNGVSHTFRLLEQGGHRISDEVGNLAKGFLDEWCRDE